MTPRSFCRSAIAAFLSMVLAACASMPPPTLSRGQQRPPAADGAAADGVQTETLEDTEGPRAQIRRGTGQVINQRAATAPPPNLGGSTGEASFNFEGEPLHAVVKAILGDMLGQNYTIAPGVQGTVTLATPRTVSPAQAYVLLERALADNNARMVYSGGMYQIVPADAALPSGTVAPRTGGAAAARGFEVRVVPLRYISATEMEKVLKPYARPNAIVAVDNGRNTITVSGSRVELENYLRTIEIFDVDWLSGMSVGVFPLQTGKATQVVADLEKVFGEQSKSPVAGMFRFLPLEGANAVLVITPQAEYLDDIGDWLERIDSSGAGARLYSYELKYIKARDLAERLAEVFGGGSGRSGNGESGGSLMPGLSGVSIGSGAGGLGSDGKIDSGSSIDSMGGSSGSSGSGGGLGSGSLSLSQDRGGSSSVTLEVDGDRVGVSALDETNALLVRTTPSAWKSIREVVERLDVMPLQVHIEAQVAQVQLSGQLEYGVQWYIENGGVGVPGVPGLDLGANPLIPRSWSTFGGSVTGSGASWTLFKSDAAAIIKALDNVSDVRLLSTPSLFVRNNVEAELNVGDRIPVSTISVNPILGSDNSLTSVQYLETGTILKVRPRVTQDGTVFLEIVQEISAPAGQPDNNGNYRITTRRMKTEAAAQDGDTIMLAGLITDGVERGAGGIPGLSRIPVLGALFGTQNSRTERSETIVLITARIVRNNADARSLTDEYSRRFRAMEPLHRTKD
ncbi:type II secretion system protein GspD [Luteimonas marina]|uniref:Type II secretion system protein GspD n=1 Tax=Luteimonas marina TaxID=488485 RepID=A0A5C5U2K8_9GAMM|nr:type II secretion system secretin GspD [Luteimonas marina]TWT20184.1 type II secretion system protein GspD [Luteimonas marina]